MKSEKSESIERRLNHPDKEAKQQSKTDPLRAPADIQGEKKATLRHLDGWQRPVSLVRKQTEESLTHSKINRTLAFHPEPWDLRSSEIRHPWCPTDLVCHRSPTSAFSQGIRCSPFECQ